MAEIEIRRAGEEDIDGLVGLWIESFHDPEDYIRLFYRRNFPAMEVWVILYDGCLAAMANLLPATVQDGQTEQKAWMGYAGCVRKSMRSRGIWRYMLEFLKKHLEEQGTALFFKPAEGLAGYYQARGFSVEARWSLLTIESGKKTEGVKFSPLDPEDYERLRAEAFSGIPYVRWDREYLAWAIEENLYCGGYAEKLRTESGEYALLAFKKDGLLTIMETTMPPEKVENMAGNLLERYGADRILLRVNDLGEGFPGVVSSMSIYNRIKNPYVSVMLL